jgi:hypothetical protein
MEHIFTFRKKHLSNLEQSHKLLLQTHPQNQKISFGDSHENDSFPPLAEAPFKLPTTVPTHYVAGLWSGARLQSRRQAAQ